MCPFRRTPRLAFAKDACQCRLAHLDRLSPQVRAVQLQQVEGVEDARSSFGRRQRRSFDWHNLIVLV
jgi:hypothetical protein